MYCIYTIVATGLSVPKMLPCIMHAAICLEFYKDKRSDHMQLWSRFSR